MATAPAHPNSTNMNFDKGEAVTLIIGDEKHEMIVHASYICANSEFFKTALKKEWLEGQTRTINMPEEDWKTMTDCLNFTYSGKLPTARLTDDDPFAAYLDSYPDLARSYTLGNRLLDSVVRNAVIKEFVRIEEGGNIRRAYAVPWSSARCWGFYDVRRKVCAASMAWSIVLH